MALVKTGSGIQVLAGANTYTGGTVVNAGTLQAVNAAALGNVANTLQVNGGLLDMYGNNITTGLLSGSSGSISSSIGTSVLTISNSGLSSSFSGAIVNSTGGQPSLTLGAGTLTLLGGNTYTGATTVRPNTMLQVGSGGTLGGTAGTPVSVNGVLALGDGNGPAGLVTAASLAGTGSIVDMSSSKSTLVVNYNGATLDRFSGVIGGPGTNQNNIALVFAGSGQVNLTGVSTYSGSTTVSAGTLNLSGGLPNSNVNVLAGGAPVGAGDGVTTGIVGGSLTAGSSSIIGALAGDSGISLTIAGSLTLGGASATASGRQTTLTYVPGTAGIEQIKSGPLKVNLGGVYVNIIPAADGTDHGGNAYASTGTYTLMSYSSTSGTPRFSFGTAVTPLLSTSAANNRLLYTLVPSGTSLKLTVTSLTGNSNAPPVAFFDHQVSNIWDDLSQSKVNWSMDAAGGTLAGMIPGPTSDVVLASTSPASLPMTLGGPTTINSLNTNANSSAGQTINGDGFGSLLTIVARATATRPLTAVTPAIRRGSGYPWPRRRVR